MELKIVKPKLTKEQSQFLRNLEDTKQQILWRARQLEYWGKHHPDILSADTAELLVAVGQRIAELVDITCGIGANNEIKRIR